MKRIFLFIAAAMIVVGLAFCLTPELMKADIRLASGLWELARPSRQADSDFYFRKSQWLADLRTVQAGFRFLWETTHGDGASAKGLPSLPQGKSQLLTGSAGTSNNLAIPATLPGDPT